MFKILNHNCDILLKKCEQINVFFEKSKIATFIFVGESIGVCLVARLDCYAIKKSVVADTNCQLPTV